MFRPSAKVRQICQWRTEFAWRVRKKKLANSPLANGFLAGQTKLANLFSLRTIARARQPFFLHTSKESATTIQNTKSMKLTSFFQSTASTQTNSHEKTALVFKEPSSAANPPKAQEDTLSNRLIGGKAKKRIAMKIGCQRAQKKPESWRE